jgi:hypothetical protein
MQLSLRPYVTTGVAIVGASVLVAAPISPAPPDITIANPAEGLALAQSTTDVELASLLSDLLADFNLVATVGGDVTQVFIDAIGELPEALARLTAAGIENPELIPSLLSALVYGFLNPPGNVVPPLPAPIPSLLSDVFVALTPLITLLPPELAGDVITVAVSLFGVLGDALGILPNPVPGLAAAADVVLPDFVGDLTGAFSTLLSAVGVSIGGGIITLPTPAMPIPVNVPGLFGFIGAAPERLLEITQGVIGGTIPLPSALSTIVYSLVYPLPVSPGPPIPIAASLLSIVALPVVAALADILPPDAAGPFLEAFGAVGDVIVRALGILPAPLPPFPQPTMMFTAAESVVEQPTGLEGVLGAVRLAAEGVLDDLGDLPEGIQLIVRGVIDNPATAPLAIVRLANTGIDGIQDAIAPIAGAFIGALPEGLRASAGMAFQRLGAAIDGVQQDIEDAVAPPAETRVAGNQLQSTAANLDATADAGQDQVDGPEVKPKKHRQMVNLNVFKVNPLDQDDEDEQVGANAAGDEGTTTVKHRPGFGKTPVRDLVNRITSAFDTDRDEGGSESETDTEADAEAG